MSKQYKRYKIEPLFFFEREWVSLGHTFSVQLGHPSEQDLQKVLDMFRQKMPQALIYDHKFEVTELKGESNCPIITWDYLKGFFWEPEIIDQWYLASMFPSLDLLSKEWQSVIGSEVFELKTLRLKGMSMCLLLFCGTNILLKFKDDIRVLNRVTHKAALSHIISHTDATELLINHDEPIQFLELEIMRELDYNDE